MIKLRHGLQLAVLLFVVLALFPCTLSATEIVYTFVVVDRYPHDPMAFTQGLVFYDGFFYEGTGLYGRSSLRKVRLEDGGVVEQVDLDDALFGEGVTILGDKIVQLTWKEGWGLVYERSSLERIDTFRYDGEGWGLTTDGEYLIMSDGSHRLTYLDPESYKPIKELEVRGEEGAVSSLNELEYVDGEIFANVWFDHRICRIDAQTGDVLGWIDLSDLYALERTENSDVDVVNGIAYDQENGRLFVTGKLWRHIYEIRLEPGR